jgi:hypothetical protein
VRLTNSLHTCDEASSDLQNATMPRVGDLSSIGKVTATRLWLCTQHVLTRIDKDLSRF